MIRYEDSTHTYFNSKGEVIPSVSELVDFACGQTYKDVPKEVLERAAAHGTAVHNLMQEVVEGRMTQEELHLKHLDPKIKGAVLQGIALLKKYHFKIKECEKIVHYKERFGGRFDMKSADNFIIDTKTSRIAHIDRLAWQLGFYYLAEGLDPGIGYCIHLPRNEAGKMILIHCHSNKDCLYMLEKYEKEQANKSPFHFTFC